MRFLYNAPAILHEDALIIGDTHFGMEDKLRRKGIFHEKASEHVFNRIKELLAQYDAEKLILLGDVKENITVLDARTAHLLSKLKMLAELIIVKGNHDGGIEEAGTAVIRPEGFVYKGLALAHGHSWPKEELMQCERIVCAHQHPMIAFRDRSGKIHDEPVWLIAPSDKNKIAERYKNFNGKIELVMMPAFNPLVGSPVNLYSKKHLGPLLHNKLFKADDALVFRLDGTSLGRLEKLKA